MEQMTSKNSIELLYEEIKPIAMRVRESILKSKENIGVDASTLYRWYSNFNKSAPHPFKLRNMLQYDLKMTSLKSILNNYGGEIAQYLKRSFVTQTLTETDKMKSSFELQDQYDAYIYFVCGTLRGADREEIITMIGNILAKKSEIDSTLITKEMIYAFGKMANDRINRLIDFGFIKEKNNGKLVRTNNKINTNDERFLSFISHINSDFLRLEDFSTGQNANYIISGSISQNKHKELCSRIKEFAIKINEEISNVETENIDTIPVYFSLTGERFLFDCKGDLK